MKCMIPTAMYILFIVLVFSGVVGLGCLYLMIHDFIDSCMVSNDEIH